MTRKQWFGIFIMSIIAVSSAIIKNKFFSDADNYESFSFDRVLSVSKQDIDWDKKPTSESELQDYVLEVSDIVLKADNTLDFSMSFKRAPLILESVLGSQLGREVFQITNQTILTPDTIQVSGLDMSKFNPFEPFIFSFIYEYDSGVRARHKVEIELN